VSADAAEPAPICLPPRPIARSPRTQLPPGTCDCHFHVFAEGAPLAEPRSYTPRMETLTGWLRLAEAAGIARGVLVQPSVYGLDNSVLLAALAARPDRLRGVVVIGPDTGDAELRRLHAAGVRGVRINLRNKSGIGLDAVPGLCRRIAPLGWHLQFQIGPAEIGAVGAIAAEYDIDAVVDHAAFIPLAAPEAPSQVDALQRLLDRSNVHVKLSAPYRLTAAPPYDAFGNLARRLVGSHPDRLLWGSDWPHTELFESMPDDTDLIEAVLDWFGDDSVRRQILVDNPDRLYWSDR
jgi:predicted TIM-barrel fold metal-dependent hydrolase